MVAQWSGGVRLGEVEGEEVAGAPEWSLYSAAVADEVFGVPCEALEHPFEGFALAFPEWRIGLVETLAEELEARG